MARQKFAEAGARDGRTPLRAPCAGGRLMKAMYPCPCSDAPGGGAVLSSLDAAGQDLESGSSSGCAAPA